MSSFSKTIWLRFHEDRRMIVDSPNSPHNGHTLIFGDRQPDGRWAVTCSCGKTGGLFKIDEESDPTNAPSGA